MNANKDTGSSWERTNERGILPEAVDQTLTDQWNRFRVDAAGYLDAHYGLEYADPQALWANGCPMGNGDLGVLAYGPPEACHFSFSKTDLWDYRSLDEPSRPPVPFDKLRAALAGGDAAFLSQAQKQANRVDRPQISPKPGGLLRLELFPASVASRFRQRLSMAHAETVQTWVPAGNRGYKQQDLEADTVSLISFVHAARNVLVARVDSHGGGYGDVLFSLGRSRDPDMEAAQVRCEENHFWIRQELPGGQHFILMGAVDAGTVRTAVGFNRVEGCLVPETREVTFYVTLVTSKDSADPLAEAHRNLDDAASMGFDRLRATHRQWWHDFWRRGFVCTPWPTVERAWYYALYLQASCCRPGRLSPGLQGNWIKENYPAWSADFHNNINMQILYWGQYTANRLELAEPFYRLFWEVLPQVKKDTADYFKMRGARYPISMGPDGRETAPGILLATWIGAGGWLAQHFWWHYRYSGDREFLRRYAYPLLKECVLFYEDYLQKDDQGKYYLFPSLQMEINVGRIDGAGRNSSWDLPIIIRAFQMALAAAHELNVDRDDQARWRSILDALPGVPANDEGVWMEFADKGGLWHQWDWSRFMAIFPMEIVGPDHGSPDLRAQARNTVEELYRFRAEPEKEQGFAGALLGVALFRMREAERGLNVANYVCSALSPSGFITRHDAFFLQVDAPPGLSIFLNEMLLQSYDGVLRAFPAVPPSPEPVRFHGLRAQGGFLVSGERRENRVAYVIVKSLDGNPLRMINPFVKEPDLGVQVKVYELSPETRFDTAGDQMAMEPYLDHIYLPNQLIEFPTRKDRVYLISKEIPWFSTIPVVDL